MSAPKTPAQALQSAVAVGMAQLAKTAKLPPLSWSIRPDGDLRLSGYAGADHTDDETGPVLERWARYLKLMETTEPVSPGTREFRGRISGLEVEVWGVVDRDAFESGAPFSDELGSAPFSDELGSAPGAPEQP